MRFCGSSEGRYRTWDSIRRRRRSRWASLGEPFQPSGSKSEGFLGFFVRRTIELRAVMDRIFAGRVARLLLGDPGRWWCPQEARELRQPVNDGGRGRRRQCSKSRQELRGPPRLPRPRPRRGSRTRRLDTFADDGHFLPSNLISGSAIWIKPSPRAVEESVAKADTLQRLSPLKPRLELGIHLGAQRHTGAGRSPVRRTRRPHASGFQEKAA